MAPINIIYCEMIFTFEDIEQQILTESFNYNIFTQDFFRQFIINSLSPFEFNKLIKISICISGENIHGLEDLPDFVIQTNGKFYKDFFI
jgi:hypothetical protein